MAIRNSFSHKDLHYTLTWHAAADPLCVLPVAEQPLTINGELTCGAYAAMAAKKGQNNSRKKPVRPVRAVGFVIDPSQDPQHALIAGLAALRDEPGVLLRCHLDDTGTDAFKARYLRRLFIAAVLARQRLGANCDQGEQDARGGQVIIPPDDPQFAYLAGYFRDRGQDTNKASTANRDYPFGSDVVHSIHQRLFHPRGMRGKAKKTLRLIWPERAGADGLFFWTAQDYEAVCQRARESTNDRIVVGEDFAPVSSEGVSPATLQSIALKLNHTEQPLDTGLSWQELYRKAVLPTFREPAFIDIPVRRRIERRGVDDDELRPPKSFQEAAGQSRHLLLIGPSGSGKTTWMRQLAADIADGRCTLGCSNPLPIYVDLSLFIPLEPRERQPVLASTIAESLAEQFSALSAEHWRHWDIFHSQGGRPRESWTGRREARDLLRTTIRQWLEEPSAIQTELVLLLDGFDRIPLAYRARLDPALAAFLNELPLSYRCILSSRQDASTYQRSSERGLPNYLEFQLGEMDDEGIDNYLALRIGARLVERVWRDLAPASHREELLRNPLYLSLVADQIERQPTINLPRSLPEMLQNHTSRQLNRALDCDPSLQDHCSPSDVHHLLSLIAAQLVDSGHTRLAFPNVTLNWPHEIDIRRTLRWAERAGLLASDASLPTGLPGRYYLYFAHDSLRDYYAGCYLLSLSPEQLHSNIRRYVQRYSWDTAWTVYFALATDAELAQSCIEALMQVDLALAALCAGYCPVLPLHCIRSLLDTIVTSKTFFKYEFALARLNRPDLAASTDHLLAHLDASALIAMRERYLGHALLQMSLHMCLGRTLGNDALPVLADFYASSPDFMSRSCAIAGMASVNSPQGVRSAYDYLQDMIARDHVDHSWTSFLRHSISYRPSLSEVRAWWNEYDGEYVALALAAVRDSSLDAMSDDDEDFLKQCALSDNADPHIRRAAVSALLRARVPYWRDLIPESDPSADHYYRKAAELALPGWEASVASRLGSAAALSVFQRFATQEAHEHMACMVLAHDLPSCFLAFNSSWSGYDPIQRGLETLDILRDRLGPESARELIGAKHPDDERLPLILYYLGDESREAEVERIWNTLVSRLTGEEEYPDPTDNEVGLLRPMIREAYTEQHTHSDHRAAEGTPTEEYYRDQAKTRWHDIWRKSDIRDTLPYAIRAAAQALGPDLLPGMTSIQQSIADSPLAVRVEALAAAAALPGSNPAAVISNALALRKSYSFNPYVERMSGAAVDVVLPRCPATDARRIWDAVYQTYLAMEVTAERNCRRVLSALIVILSTKDVDDVLHSVRRACSNGGDSFMHRLRSFKLAVDLCHRLGSRRLDIFGRWPPPVDDAPEQAEGDS